MFIFVIHWKDTKCQLGNYKIIVGKFSYIISIHLLGTNVCLWMIRLWRANQGWSMWTQVNLSLLYNERFHDSINVGHIICPGHRENRKAKLDNIFREKSFYIKMLLVQEQNILHIFLRSHEGFVGSWSLVKLGHKRFHRCS